MVPGSGGSVSLRVGTKFSPENRFLNENDHRRYDILSSERFLVDDRQEGVATVSSVRADLSIDKTRLQSRSGLSVPVML